MAKDKDTRPEVTQVPEDAPRSFSHLLHQIGEGQFHAELSETMHELTKKLEAHAYDFSKAKGKITLSLTVEIDREGLVTIDPEVTTKVPKPARKRGRFWIAPGGHLAAENPKQQQLPLREVPSPRTRAVEAPAADPPRGV
jgi:hypothetical protein